MDGVVFSDHRDSLSQKWLKLTRNFEDRGENVKLLTNDDGRNG